ncbi:tellurite resistance TerB family protein [Mailhella sp.]|uniref:tellurite resistance TerB family protein n=1 Tax=Mailhella sp. TaxID=1981029 RepID=UPI004062B054
MSILNILSSASLGGALQTLTREAQKVASSAGKNAPGGMGGLLGAGMLGALLGKSVSSDLVKNAALVGAGAVAWNFYQKWSQARAEQAAPAQCEPWGGRPAADQWQSQSPMVMQLDPTAMLVMRAMIFAARADGSVDALEQQRIDTILQNMLQGQDVRAQLDAMESEMLDPRKIASSVQSPEQGEDVYRLSCVVIDIDHFMERSYLDALGDALGISPARRTELEADASQGRRQLQSAAMA